MSGIAVTERYIVTAKGLQIDLYDYDNHVLIEIPSAVANDQINGIAVSSDSKYLAVSTNLAKQLLLYDLPGAKNSKVFALPRSSSKMRFTPTNTHILLADKSGDVLSFDINEDDTVDQPKDKKILGHLSLILDILQSSDGKYIITSDRDEKIRVSCYPSVYQIQTYCLGHREYVNHVEELPHSGKYLVSSSGDGTVKIWDFIEGKNECTIDTNSDVDNAELRDTFKEKMDQDGVQIDYLPIIHLTISKLNENCSILAVSVHTYEMLLIYSLNSSDGKITPKLETKLKLEKFPTAIQFHRSNLLIYNDSDFIITFYNVQYSNGIVTLEKSKEEKVFDSSLKSQCNLNDHFETIKLLFKRKFDNVQEYQERKKQRLEKSAIKNAAYLCVFFYSLLQNISHY